MKTIRHNTYETNSSSTHSITIISKSKDRKSKFRRAEIFEDGILYPGNLNDSEAYTHIPTGEEGYVVKCYTPHQKAALTVHYLNACDEYVNYDSSGDITTEQYNAFKLEAIRILSERLGLKEIRDWEDCNGFYYSGENDECPIVDVLEDGDRITAFNKFVTDVILNEDMLMIDEDIPY
jgi:hypothetical protein